MNDLACSAAAPLMSKVYAMISSQSVWSSTPLGHTEVQLRRFVLNDREYPAGTAKFRQAIRELWSRLEAYWQVKDRMDDLDVEEQMAQADLQAASMPRLLPWSRMRQAARRQKARLVLTRIARIRQMLQFDLRERIMRETFVLLDEAQRNAPSPDDANAFSVEAEMKTWEHRAESTPKLKELLVDGKGN